MKQFAAAAFFVFFLVSPAHAQSRDQNWSLCEGGDPNLSIPACTALIESGAEIPRNLAIAHNNRGITHSDRGEFDRAIADYERALALNPELASALNSLAWDLATMPAATLRDGPRAVELAEKAYVLDKRQPGFLDTLAAAYAEAGRFEDAVRMQKQAIDLLEETDVVRQVVADFESRLRLYENNQPYHRSR